MWKNLKDLKLLLIATIIVCSVAGYSLFMGGCAQIQEYVEKIDSSNPIVIETADSVGYGLGLVAAKNGRIREKIEKHYAEIESGDLTIGAVNGIMDALDAEGEEYKFLARKILRLLDLVGAQVTGGRVTELVKIDPAILQAGKEGYIAALKLSGKS